MKKKFNITGTCIPEKHYMVDISDKLEKILELIDNEEYFIINRPRQYGKTTTLYMLENLLNKTENYLCFSISFEGLGEDIFKNEENFCIELMNILAESIEYKSKEIFDFIITQSEETKNFRILSKVISKLISKYNKNFVLIIDEIDQSSNNEIIINFLGMLRKKYLSRSSGKASTFHNVILAGVHDVKSLKIKIRPDEEHKYNSPWNIASDFNIDMSFSKKEIETMLTDYVNSTGAKLNKGYFSDKLYFYTSGYPFLVSKLCKIIDETLMNKENNEWQKEYLEKAVKELLRESNTNFSSLIKNIQNDIKLRDLVKKIIIDGNEVTFNEDNPLITLGVTYGFFRNENGKVKIHNRIYEQRIYDYMSSIIETDTDLSFYNERAQFITETGSLDIKKILLKFQDFMKHEYPKKQTSFLEADGRLLFLAFLSPIINGTGFAFKEVRGGEEKRLDIVITYGTEMFILELKKWYGDEYHKKGQIQLAEYLDQYGLEEGYLLIFDFRKNTGLSGNIEESQVKIRDRQKKILEFYC